MSFRDKVAEVLLMVAVEWVASPAWRRSYHQAEVFGEPAPEPTTIEDYQRHLIEMHDFDYGDDALNPWCGTCGERIEVPGQDCMVSEEPCFPDVMDLAAMHADAHDDNECYPAHMHGG